MTRPIIDKVINILRVEKGMLLDRQLARSLTTRTWLAMLINRYYVYRTTQPLLRSAYRFYLSRFPSQKKLIYEKQYDVLIVLDACRYDYFEEIVWRYLDGKLLPVRSPASVTIEWLRAVWANKRWDDIVYVTASPMVNKRGIVSEFDARRHFLDVIEVWDKGWDERLSTVPPGPVNAATRLAVAKYKLRGKKLGRDYKLVLHYVQPHAPYIKFRKITEIITRTPLADEIADVVLRREGRLAGKIAIDYVILAILKEYLKDTNKVNKALRDAYRENLKWVLSYVADLVTKLDTAKIAITADHGELLGEYGLYFHMSLQVPHLRIVPWFIVKQ